MVLLRWIRNPKLKSNDFIQQKKEGRLMAITCAIAVNQRNIDRAETRALRHCPEYDATNPLWIILND
jgi:hypothetical protein